MTKTKLQDGTAIYCLRKPEAKMLDHHVDGYLQNGIEINDNDVVFDVGANIGVFGIRAIQKGQNVTVHCFEPIPDIADVLKTTPKLLVKTDFMFINVVYPQKMGKQPLLTSRILPHFQRYIQNNGMKIQVPSKMQLKEP